MSHISISPHGSFTGGQRTSTPAATSSSYAAVMSATWSHNLTAGEGVLGAARDLQEAAAQEVDRAALGTRTELAVDGQAQLLAVEGAGPLGVGGAEQGPAAQYMHHAPGA